MLRNGGDEGGSWDTMVGVKDMFGGGLDMSVASAIFTVELLVMRGTSFQKSSLKEIKSGL